MSRDNEPKIAGSLQTAHRVTRDGRTLLVDQVIETLKIDILKQRYRVGDILPSMIDLAKAFGTSEKTTRTALRRLREEGWIRPVRGTGSIVLTRGMAPLLKGRVLICFASVHTSYFALQLRMCLERALRKAGYELSMVTTFAWVPGADFTELGRRLKEPWDLVVEVGYDRRVRKLIERAGHRFIALGSGARTGPSEALNFVATIQILMGLALPEFYRRAAQQNIHRVWQFVIRRGGFDLTGPLQAQGVKTTTFRLRKQRSSDTPARFALKTLDGLVKAGRRLPDVIFFTDDHFCEAGLVALLAHGVRIPEDVRIVTFSIRGAEPAFTKPLSSLVIDPMALGKTVSEIVLAALRGEDVPPETVLGSSWQPGETF